MPLLSTHIFKKICSFLRFLIYLHRFVEIWVFLPLLRVKSPLRRSRARFPLLSPTVTSSPGAGEVFPQRESQGLRLVAKVSGAMRKLPAVLLAERALPLPTQKAPLPYAESGAFFNLFLPSCGKPGAVLVLLIGGDHDLQAAHVRLQHFGDGHAAVGLQMVL